MVMQRCSCARKIQAQTVTKILPIDSVGFNRKSRQVNAHEALCTGLLNWSTKQHTESGSDRMSLMDLRKALWEPGCKD